MRLHFVIAVIAPCCAWQKPELGWRQAYFLMIYYIGQLPTASLWVSPEGFSEEVVEKVINWQAQQMLYETLELKY